MSIPTMIAATALAIAGVTVSPTTEAAAENFIGRQMPKLNSDRMTPESSLGNGDALALLLLMQQVHTPFIRSAIIAFLRINHILCFIS